MSYGLCFRACVSTSISELLCSLVVSKFDIQSQVVTSVWVQLPQGANVANLSQYDPGCGTEHKILTLTSVNQYFCASISGSAFGRVSCRTCISEHVFQSMYLRALVSEHVFQCQNFINTGHVFESVYFRV